MKPPMAGYCHRCLVAVFVLYSIFGAHFQVETCLTLISNPLGDVNPSNDMMLEVGTSLAINCTLYPDNVRKMLSSGISSKNIRFKLMPRYGDLSKWLSNENVHIIDENTAQLRITNLTMNHNGKYSCYISVRKPLVSYRNSLVCATAVTVGYPPLDIEGEDLQCQSLNWQRLECAWGVPNNTIPTVYKFYYSSIDEGRNKEIECKPYRNIPNKCVLTVKANASLNEGFYRQTSKYYYFTIRGKNMFGESKNSFQLDHYNYVTPNPPDAFFVDKVKPRSMKLRWLTPTGMNGFPNGLTYQVAFQSQWDKPNEWMVLSTEDVSLQLNGLLPFTVYKLNIRCKSASVEDPIERSWSNYSRIEHRTEPDVPRTAPNITQGMFEDHRDDQSKRSLIVYWKHVPQSLRNGADFKYYVSYTKVMNQHKRQISTTTSEEDNFSENTRATTDFYVRFDGLDVNSAYRFNIRVGNKEGSLPEIHSTQLISDKDSIVEKPTNFYVRLQVNDTYKLSWQSPTNSKVVKSYTVFWCKERTRHNYLHCKSPMDWVTVPADQHQIKLYIPDIKDTSYQFAVASNSEKSSSGMIWTECINRVGDKVYSVNAAAQHPRGIRVSWTSACIEEKARVEAFIIYYCKARNNRDNKCLGAAKKKVVNQPSSSWTNLTDVDYNTKYIIRVSYIHQNGVENEPSDPVSAITLEGVPGSVDAPISVTATNHSIVVSWRPPSRPNGIIIQYKILYGENTHVVNVDAKAKELYRATLIDDIIPDQNYQVAVAACTNIGCSTYKKFLTVTTAIGVPGVMDAPRYEGINETYIRAFWTVPKLPNGPLDMVELNVTWIHNNESKHNFYNFSNWISGTAIPIDCQLLDGENEPQAYNLTVRAVNIKNGRRLPGPWSVQTRVNMCFEAAEALAVGFIIGVTVGGSLALSLILLLLYFVIRWTIQKMDEAKAIKVQLPKGLESNGMTSLNTYKDFSNGLKSPKTSNGNLPPNYGQYKPLIPPNDSAPDLNSKKNRHESGDSAYSSNSTNELLRKRERNGSNRSAGDSDLGSGTDGLISNIAGKTHLSNHSNDSGLHCDLDNSQPSPEPVFMDSSPNFQIRGSPPDNSLKFKTPSLPIVNEIQDHESSPDDQSENTEVSDDSGTAEMNNGIKPNQYSKFSHYHDDKLKKSPCFPNSPTVGLALTDNLGNGSPYCKLGLNHLRGVYVPTYPGTAAFLSKNSRNIAGSEPNIADAETPSDSDSGNSSVVNTLFPPYTRFGLASSHTDVSPNNLPMSYSKFGIANPTDVVQNRYVPVNNFPKLSENTSPTFYPAAPYSKFGLLNIPTNESLNANPGNPYLTAQPVPKWDIPKPRNPGYVTVDRADVVLDTNPFASGKMQKPPEFDEGYSRVSSGPADTIPVPQDVDLLPDSEPILCVQSATGAIPKCSKPPQKGTPSKSTDGSCNGYIPSNSLPPGENVRSPNDYYKNNISTLDDVNSAKSLPPPLSAVDQQTATSTPKASPQPSPSQPPKTNGYEPSNHCIDPVAGSKSNGYVCIPQTGIINPSIKNNNQPLSCANLQPSLTYI